MKTLIIYTSYICNENCVFCIEHSSIKKQSLTFEDIKDNIESVIPEVDRIMISGGEPLLYPNFKDLVSYIYEQGFKGKFVVETNCSKMTSETIDFLKEITEGHLTIMSSLHGIEPIHDKLIQRKGSFAERIEGFKIVKGANIPLRINSVITSDNVYKIKALYDFVKSDIKPDVMQFSLLDYIGMAKEAYPEYMEFNVLKEEITKLFSSLGPDDKIMLERIPACILDEKYHDHILVDEYRFNISEYILLTPDRGFFRYANKPNKNDSCNSCSRINRCFGVYPATPEGWFQYSPIK